MKHDEAESRLPWYLAGSLHEEEMAAVGEHLEHCEECRAELARTRVAARIFAAEHPSTEELVDDAWDRLDESRSSTIRAHLADCGGCREEWELAGSSRELESTETATMPLASVPRRAWGWPSTLAASLALVSTLAAVGILRSSREERRGLESEVATLRGEIAGRQRAADVAGRRAVDLEQELDALLAPRSGVPLIELLPESVLRGGESAATPRLGREAGPFVVLVLALEDPKASPRFVARLLGEDGREILALPATEPDATGALTLLLPLTSVPPGPLALEVSGVDGGEGTPVGRYRLELGEGFSQPKTTKDAQ